MKRKRLSPEKKTFTKVYSVKKDMSIIRENIDVKKVNV